jgi:alpha-ribazole phosphatase/probable phosphoglycerate mutase
VKPAATESRAVLEVWWVRHASTVWNSEGRWQGHTDVALCEAGRAEARCLAIRLRPIPFDAAWSSDLGRCLETASLALPDRHLLTDRRLREMPMGPLEGLTWDEAAPEVREAIHQWWTDPYGNPFPGSTESLRDVTERVQAWLDEQPVDGRIIAFTHGGVIRCCLWALTGPPRNRSWSIDLGNTGILRIRYDRQRRRAILVAHNDLSHLEESWNLPPGQKVPGD